ncbi:hypothetical protein BGZ74_005423, partial [Mortierella antarctica]
MSKFKFKVVYWLGTLNGAADTLSHMVPPEEGEGTLHDALLPQFKSLTVSSISEDNQ